MIRGANGFTVVENQSEWTGHAMAIQFIEATVLSMLVDGDGVNVDVQGDISSVSWPADLVLEGNFTRILTVSGRYVVYNSDGSAEWRL